MFHCPFCPINVHERIIGARGIRTGIGAFYQLAIYMMYHIMLYDESLNAFEQISCHRARSLSDTSGMVRI